MEGWVVAVGDEAELGKAVHVGFGAEDVALPRIGHDVVASLRQTGTWPKRHERERKQTCGKTVAHFARPSPQRVARSDHGSVLARRKGRCQGEPSLRH